MEKQAFTDRFEILRLSHDQKMASLAQHSWHDVLGIDATELAVLIEYLIPYKGAKGAVVFRKGDQESFMCLIGSGTVEIYPGKREETSEAISSLEEGNIVGEMALIDGEPRSAYAYVASETLLFVMTRSNFLRLAEDHPPIWGKLLLRIAKLMSNRLRKTNDNLGKYLHMKWRRVLQHRR